MSAPDFRLEPWTPPARLKMYEVTFEQTLYVIARSREEAEDIAEDRAMGGDCMGAATARQVSGLSSIPVDDRCTRPWAPDDIDMDGATTIAEWFAEGADR